MHQWVSKKQRKTPLFFAIYLSTGHFCHELQVLFACRCEPRQPPEGMAHLPLSEELGTMAL